MIEPNSVFSKNVFPKYKKPITKNKIFKNRMMSDDEIIFSPNIPLKIIAIPVTPPITIS